MPINSPAASGSGMLARAGSPAQPPAQEQEPGREQELGQEPDGGFEPASSEDQDYYERVVMSGMRLIFENEATKNKIVDRLNADKDHPAKALADTASILMIQIDQKIKGAIPETVVLPAAVELLEQIAGLADSLKMFPIDDAVLNHAAQLMIQSLGEEYGVQPEDIEALMASMRPDQLKQIEDAQGNFARKQPQVPNEESQDG